MSVRRFPCRVCGSLTSGADSYVVCADCLGEVELRFSEGVNSNDEFAHAPIPPEVEAKLRKLLNW